jgi:hypothetical protein
MARYTAVTRRPQRQTSRPATTRAPINGLNTKQPPGAMDENSALSLTNFVASSEGVAVRQGYRKWATGLPAVTTSLFPYQAPVSASSKLFAVSGSGIYDVTSGGAVGAPVVTGLSASQPYWQHALQSAIAEAKAILVAVNGVDMPRLYDGTSWITATQVATPAGIGQFATVDNNGTTVNMATFCDVLLHHQRLWFVKDNSTFAFYTGLGLAGGALSKLDFGPYFTRGGKLQKLCAWSVNSGADTGVSAKLVGISDRGDIVIYDGKDPADISTFTLVGTYSLGAPIGRRCTIPFQADLLYLSRDGLYPLSKYIQTSTLNSTVAVTDAIAPTISDLMDTFGTSPGFEMVTYPGQNRLVGSALGR